MTTPKLIVMLTQDDYTVNNAAAIFDACKHSRAECFGAKEQGIPEQQLKALYAAIKQCGKTAVMEVVAYTEEECLRGAALAAECGCDILLGTTYFDSVNELCRHHRIQYMPFVGEVSGRPSILDGTAQDMIAQAQDYLENGVSGIDLLGYRYTGDAHTLCQQLIEKCGLPVCVAGSINSFDRLDEIKQIAPAYFTIGSAFFDQCFGESMVDQINAVCRYMTEESCDTPKSF